MREIRGFSVLLKGTERLWAALYALPTEPNNSIFFLDGVLDGLGARRKQLARIKALALLVLSGLDVFTGGLGPHGGLDGLQAGGEHVKGSEALLILARQDIGPQLLLEGQHALGVHIDLGNTQADGLFDHIVGDAGAAVQHKGNVIRRVMDLLQRVEVQAFPVGRVHTVDVADACGQEVDAQGSDARTLGGVRNLAHAHDTVLFTADAADLGLDGKAVLVSQSHQLGGLGHVFVDGVVAAVEHDGGEPGLNTGLGIFARAFGHAENDGAVHFLRSLQRGLRPLQIVDVELAYGVVAVAGFLQHFGSVYQHNSLPSKKSFLFWAGAPSALARPARIGPTVKEDKPLSQI